MNFLLFMYGGFWFQATNSASDLTGLSSIRGRVINSFKLYYATQSQDYLIAGSLVMVVWDSLSMQ